MTDPVRGHPGDRNATPAQAGERNGRVTDKTLIARSTPGDEAGNEFSARRPQGRDGRDHGSVIEETAEAHSGCGPRSSTDWRSSDERLGHVLRAAARSGPETVSNMRVSCPIAMTGNPSIRVIRVRDSSLLDADGLAALREHGRCGE